jgi:hypothetical protein
MSGKPEKKNNKPKKATKPKAAKKAAKPARTKVANLTKDFNWDFIETFKDKGLTEDVTFSIQVDRRAAGYQDGVRVFFLHEPGRV